MRPGDIEGVDYCFVSEDEFSQRIDQGGFLEHAVVFGNHYGTSCQWVEEHLAEGVDVFLEIDWQGARAIKEIYPDSISIFILPPSLGSLHARLIGRDQDCKAVVTARFEQAVDDMLHHEDQDFIVINEYIESALTDLEHIVYACRLRTCAVRTRSQNLLAELRQKE